MNHLKPSKLTVQFLPGAQTEGPILPRRYTLTHSDSTGELLLSVGLEFNRPQISGWYTRLMRDEVLAEWIDRSKGAPPRTGTAGAGFPSAGDPASIETALDQEQDENILKGETSALYTLHLYCHVSGGLVFGGRRYREAVFRQHLPLVIECFRYGDRLLVAKFPTIAAAPILVHFQAGQVSLNRTEAFGRFEDFA